MCPIKMGIWYSSPNKIVYPETGAAAPEVKVETPAERKVLIRHRPTCVNTDLEEGITEVQENRAATGTNAQ